MYFMQSLQLMIIFLVSDSAKLFSFYDGNIAKSIREALHYCHRSETGKECSYSFIGVMRAFSRHWKFILCQTVNLA